MADLVTLNDATIDRLARRIAYYLRQADQRRVDAELAAEHRRQVPLKVIEEAAKIPADAVSAPPWKRPR